MLHDIYKSVYRTKISPNAKAFVDIESSAKSINTSKMLHVISASGLPCTGIHRMPATIQKEALICKQAYISASFCLSSFFDVNANGTAWRVQCRCCFCICKNEK